VQKTGILFGLLLLTLALQLQPSSAQEPGPDGGSAPTDDQPIDAKYVRTIDGDTIEVYLRGARVQVGLIGVDAPDLGASCGPEAATALAQMARGGLHLESDPSFHFDDRFRRMYAASTPAGESVALSLIRAGFAHADGKGKQAADLAAAEAQARGGGQGCLWGGASTSPSRTLAPAATNASTAAASVATLPAGFSDEIVASGIRQATVMAFLPDGRILIAGKPGTIQVVKNGSLLPTPLLDISQDNPDVSARRINYYSDRGLVGLAIDPNFATNGYIYVNYAYAIPGQNLADPTVAHISRFTVVGDTASPSSEKVIVGTINTPCPATPDGGDCLPNYYGVHQGGNLRFAPDGMLFASTGDGSQFNTSDAKSLNAQNINSLAGKILRIDTNGAGLNTNPFWNQNPNPNAASSKVWAVGFRNPFRVNFRPGTSIPYVGDVGNDKWEEVNVGATGANFGWPCFEGPDQGASLFRTSSVCTPLYTNPPPSGLKAPLTAYSHNGAGAAVTGGAFYTGTSYPTQYRGAYFFADYANGWIKYLTVNASDGLVNGATDFASSVTAPTDVEMGPDDSLYYLSFAYDSTSALHRIRFVGGSATATPTPTQTGTSPVAYRDTVIADSPVSYWRLGEASGSTAIDERGANAGSYVGSPTLGAPDALAGDANTAVTFNGTNQYVNVPDASGLSPEAGASGKVSVEAWAKLASLPTTQPATVVSKGTGTNSYEYALRVLPDPVGAAEFVVWSPDGSTYQHIATPAGTIAPGVWYHLVGTCDNGVACRIYVNGTERGSVTTGWGTLLPANTDAPLAIGRRSDNVQYLAGTIDEVAVYPSVLSAAQIQTHYTAGTTTGGGGNRPPVPTITTPAAGFQYQDGATISFSGSATDPEDGTIPASGLSWQIILHHCPGGACHIHPLTTASGPSGSFVDPIHGSDSHFEIILTATDSAGLQSSTSVQIFPAPSAYRDAVMADEPVGFWRLGETAGSTSAKDNVGLHVGTYVGSPTLGVAGALTGDPSTAAGFNGSGQYVNIPDDPAFSTEAGASGKISVEAWVRLASLPSVQPGTVVSKGAGGSYEYALRVHPDGTAEFVMWSPDGTTFQHVPTGAGTIAPGPWYHLVGTCDNGVVCRIYVNGTEQGSATTGWGSFLPADTTAPLSIGRRGDNVQYLAGTVDEVAVYPSVLSLARIQAHYTTGTGAATPPTSTPTPVSATSTPTPVPSSTATPTLTPMSTAVTSNYRGTVLADTPVSYWRLGEASGATASDERGALPGAYAGPPTLGAPGAISGDPNTAVRFGGSGQYVNVPDAPQLSPEAGGSGKLSIEAWVNVTSLPASGPGTVVSKGAAGAYEYALRVWSTGALELVLWAPGGTTYASVATPGGVVTPGAWYYLVGTCDNGVACRIYVNGVERANKPSNWGAKLPADTAAPLSIGRRGDNVQYLAGTIDEVAVYSTVLSPTRIQAHYTAAGGTVALTVATPVTGVDPPVAPACQPRPAIAVTTARGAAGELRVTVGTGTNPETPQNEIQRIAVGAATNADVQIGSQRGTGNFTVSLPAGVQQTGFTVRRSAPGQASTVPLTVTDACGDWQTLVGGGANAF
jgi:glucose/arabinose dehydrogenase